MARVVHRVVLKLTEDPEQKQIIYSRDETLAEQKIDAFKRAMSSSLSIAPGNTEGLSFGDVDAVRAWYIESDQDFELTINGLGPFLFQKADTAAKRKVKAMNEMSITTLSVKNVGTVVLSGSYAVWGDPV